MEIPRTEQLMGGKNVTWPTKKQAYKAKLRDTKVEVSKEKRVRRACQICRSEEVETEQRVLVEWLAPHYQRVSVKRKKVLQC